MKAEWLLAHHQEHRCRLTLLETTLAQYKAGKRDDLLSEQIIEEMTLSTPSLSGTPVTKGNGSKTEYIALHYEEQLRIREKEEPERLTAEIQKLRFYISICDTLLGSLSPDERWLIENKYVQHKTYDRMVTELPAGIAPLSKSALWYRCTQLLKRLDALMENIAI